MASNSATSYRGLGLLFWTIVLCCSALLTSAQSYSKYGGLITEIPDDIPLNVTSIFIRFTSITEVGLQSFKNLTKLYNLNLDDNQIDSIADHAFMDAPIWNLYLDGNQLERVPNLTDISDTLVNLDLSKNKIKLISPSFFARMEKLRYVNLGFNRLIEFPDFSELPLDNSLGSLYLLNNPLNNAPPGTFHRLKKLTRLYLQDLSNLTEIPDLQDSPIRNLFMQGNRITSVTAAKRQHIGDPWP